MATMKASQERMGALMDVSLETTGVVPRKDFGESGKTRNHNGRVSIRDGNGSYWSNGESIWGPASSVRALPTAEETDPGRWWVPKEVGRRPQTDDLPCRSCTA
jgi:hypothetical protein